MVPTLPWEGFSTALQHYLFYLEPMRPCNISMGRGKTMVEFFSAAIVVRV